MPCSRELCKVAIRCGNRETHELPLARPFRFPSCSYKCIGCVTLSTFTPLPSSRVRIFVFDTPLSFHRRIFTIDMARTSRTVPRVNDAASSSRSPKEETRAVPFLEQCTPPDLDVSEDFNVDATSSTSGRCVPILARCPDTLAS